jgi:hypothetical protein
MRGHDVAGAFWAAVRRLITVLDGTRSTAIVAMLHSPCQPAWRAPTWGITLPAGPSPMMFETELVGIERRDPGSSTMEYD